VKLSADDIPTSQVRGLRWAGLLQILRRVLHECALSSNTNGLNVPKGSPPCCATNACSCTPWRGRQPLHDSSITHGPVRDQPGGITPSHRPTPQVVVTGDAAAGARLIELGGARIDDVTAAADEGRVFEVSARTCCTCVDDLAESEGRADSGAEAVKPGRSCRAARVAWALSSL
jgi:hypothetical protein